MSEYAVLGPVDPQLGQYPGASILKGRREKAYCGSGRSDPHHGGSG